MKISVFQKIVRALITVMTVGAIVLMTIHLVEYIMISNSFRQSSSSIMDNEIVAMVCEILVPVSFLLELLGLFIWSMLSGLMFTKVGLIVPYIFLLACLAGVLVLSRYLTKFKGTRTSIMVNLALILLDLPFVLIVNSRNFNWSINDIGLFISLTVHFVTAFFLIMSLIYTRKNEIWFSDFRPSPHAYQMNSGYQSQVREGMTEKEIKSTKHSWLFAPRAARALTIAVSVGTLIVMLIEFISGRLAPDSVASEFGTGIGMLSVCSVCSPLNWFYSSIGGMFALQPKAFITAACILAYIGALLFMQRYFTRDSRLTKPALVFTLTVAVIDTMPFLSVLGLICFVGVIVHGFWIATLIISLRKISVKRGSRKKNKKS